MKTIVCWLLLIVMQATPALAQVRDPAVHFFQPKLGDLHGDLDIARQEGKLGVLLMSLSGKARRRGGAGPARRSNAARRPPGRAIGCVAVSPSG